MSSGKLARKIAAGLILGGFALVLVFQACGGPMGATFKQPSAGPLDSDPNGSPTTSSTTTSTTSSTLPIDPPEGSTSSSTSSTSSSTSTTSSTTSTSNSSTSTSSSTTLAPTGFNLFRPTCHSGTFCRTISNLVHRPSVGNEVRELSYQPPNGNYRRARVVLEVTNGGWDDLDSASHMLFWLARNALSRDMIGFSVMRSPSKDTIVYRYGMNLQLAEKARIIEAFDWPQGNTYRVFYLYDSIANNTVFVLQTLAGNEVFRAEKIGNPHNFYPPAFTDEKEVDLVPVSFNAQTLDLHIGYPLGDPSSPGYNPNEVPTYGWEYRNLLLELKP